MGRPTKYRKSFVGIAEEYLEQCIDTHEVVEYGRTGQIVWNVEFPSIAGLAVYMKVGRSRIYDWAERHPEFQDILDTILVEQEKRLLEKGLGGTYNATIAKLLLAKHGYREAHDVTSDGKPLAPVLIDSSIAEKYHDATSGPTDDSPK